jgi:polar amino acid transport system substrate-binding protein
VRRLALLCVVAFACLAGPAAAAPPATLTPGQLTVGLSMPTEGFQVGVVNGAQVIYARGFEIDLANELTRRLELQGAAFSQNAFEALLAAGAKTWDIALAEVTITRARARNVDFSVPYMTVDQGVLVSQFLRSTPRSAAALRRLRLCAQRGTTGADVIARRIRPARAPTLVADIPGLMLYLQTGRCDAIVADLPMLATLKARAPRRYGEVTGKIRTGERYGVVLPKGSTLTGPVDAALTAMRADGTITRLQRPWLALNLSSVPTLSTASGGAQ